MSEQNKPRFQAFTLADLLNHSDDEWRVIEQDTFAALPLEARKARIDRHRRHLADYYAEFLETLVLAFGYRCLACESVHRIEIDHIQPLSLGGLTSITNLQLLCVICNRTKGSKHKDYRPYKLDEGAAWSLSQRTPLW